MAQKKNLPDDIFPCKDCVLIVQRKYANHRMEINDSMDTLLIYEDSKIIKREPIRKMGIGCRHCKGYFSCEMSFLEMVKVVDREMKRERRRTE
jgi:ribosomal protein S26